MSRNDAVNYILEHVSDKSDEPVFVFLARDMMAIIALTAYANALHATAHNGDPAMTEERADRLLTKHDRLRSVIEEFSNYRPVRLPD